MKTTLMILSAILISTSALADVRVDSFDIHGTVAVSLEKALIAAGAKTTVLMDTSNMQVSNVDCTSGVMERAPVHAYTNCTFQQMIAPRCLPGQLCSHMVRNENLEVNGALAKAVDNALADAGVKAQHFTENSRRFAVKVTCNNMMANIGRMTSCSLVVPGGM